MLKLPSSHFNNKIKINLLIVSNINLQAWLVLFSSAFTANCIAYFQEVLGNLSLKTINVSTNLLFLESAIMMFVKCFLDIFRNLPNIIDGNFFNGFIRQVFLQSSINDVS